MRIIRTLIGLDWSDVKSLCHRRLPSVFLFLLAVTQPSIARALCGEDTNTVDGTRRSCTLSNGAVHFQFDDTDLCDVDGPDSDELPDFVTACVGGPEQIGATATELFYESVRFNYSGAARYIEVIDDVGVTSTLDTVDPDDAGINENGRVFVSFWIRPYGTAGTSIIFFKGQDTAGTLDGNQRNYSLELDHSTKLLRFKYTEGSGTLRTCNPTGNPQLDVAPIAADAVWQNVVIGIARPGHDTPPFHMWLNGQPRIDGTAAECGIPMGGNEDNKRLLPNDDKLYIGGHPDHTFGSFDLDEFRIDVNNHPQGGASNLTAHNSGGVMINQVLFGHPTIEDRILLYRPLNVKADPVTLADATLVDSPDGTGDTYQFITTTPLTMSPGDYVEVRLCGSSCTADAQGTACAVRGTQFSKNAATDELGEGDPAGTGCLLDDTNTCLGPDDLVRFRMTNSYRGSAVAWGSPPVDGNINDVVTGFDRSGLWPTTGGAGTNPYGLAVDTAMPGITVGFRRAQTGNDAAPASNWTELRDDNLAQVITCADLGGPTGATGRLASLSGVQDKRDVHLEWETLDESEAAHFRVFRSKHGPTGPFTKIATVSAAGDPWGSSYVHRDKNVGGVERTLWYALEMVAATDGAVIDSHPAVAVDLKPVSAKVGACGCSQLDARPSMLAGLLALAAPLAVWRRRRRHS